MSGIWRHRSASVTMLMSILYVGWNQCHSSPCLHDINGRFYRGVMNKSESGRICLPWRIHADMFTLSNLNIESYSENSCRNPNKSESLWCYTTNDTTERCFVPMCPDNPKANYCILLPEIHFEACPMLLPVTVSFNDSSFNTFALCCAPRTTGVLDLLIKDTCLVVVIHEDAVSKEFRTCPEGFSSRKMLTTEVKRTAIYKCCRLNDPPDTKKQRHYSAIIGFTNEYGRPIFGSVLLEGTLCRSPIDLTARTMEYDWVDRIFANKSPSKITLCLYYHPTPATPFRPSHLGIMSLKQCPPGFSESNDSQGFIMFESVKLKYCWLTNVSNVYYNDQICLNLKPSIQEPYQCPKDFQSYDIASARKKKSVLRFCCRLRIDTVDNLWEGIDIFENTSMALLTKSKECPTFNYNASVDIFRINALLNWTNATLSMCNYEVRKVEIAFTKIGARCPERMFSSKAIYQSMNAFSTSSNMKYVMEYCVGSTLERFPGGSFCLYRISRNCPDGFFPISNSHELNILTSEGRLPDYSADTLCCKNSSYPNDTSSIGSFPFAMSNNIRVPFGLRLHESNDICPSISGFMSHIDHDMDGLFCAFLSEEEDYKRRHQVFWPQPVTQLRDPLRPWNVTGVLTWPWTSLSNNIYTSSISNIYPNGQFCILSQGSCTTNNRIDHLIPYTVRGYFLCCSLTHGSWPQISRIESNYTIASSSVGFVALNGNCPSVDEDIFKLKNIIYDEFHIREDLLEMAYGMKLVKIGINLHFDHQFFNISFKFCIFEVNGPTSGKSKKERIGEFIKPLEMSCPNGYKEEQRETCANYNLEPLQKHFINKTYLSTCVPFPNNQVLGGLPLNPLCSISTVKCPSNTRWRNCSRDHCRGRDSSPFVSNYYICCSKEQLKNYSRYLWPLEFSLPLLPGTEECPEITNYSSLIWTISLCWPESSTMCYYYTLPRLVHWPSGSYITLAYNSQCPSGFKLMDNDSTRLCVRANRRFSFSQFPKGNYCILSPIEERCNQTATWFSKVNSISLGDRQYSLCCSTRKTLIMNVPLSDDYVFSFLSLDRCSIIPGTRVTQRSFLHFDNIIQCIYVNNNCNEDGKCSFKFIKKRKIEEYHVIISLLVAILVVMAVVVVAFLFYSRVRQARRRSSKVGHMRMSPIYTNIDSTLDYELRDTFEEDIPSIIYDKIP